MPARFRELLEQARVRARGFASRLREGVSRTSSAAGESRPRREKTQTWTGSARAWSPDGARWERRRLEQEREAAIRDLGGLALEMTRRDRFDETLLRERAASVLGLDEKLAALSRPAQELAAEPEVPGRERCACGASLVTGARFCHGCGRPVPAAAPVFVCPHCGQPLPADVSFCTFCGNSIATDLHAGR